MIIADGLNFVPDKICVGCYVLHEDEVLFLKKAECSKHYPELWGVPAGKVNSAESPIVAIARELYEETGIIMTKKPLLLISCCVVHPHLKFQYFAYRYEVFGVRPEVVLSGEHVTCGWFKKHQVSLLELIEDEITVFEMAFGDNPTPA